MIIITVNRFGTFLSRYLEYISISSSMLIAFFSNVGFSPSSSEHKILV